MSDQSYEANDPDLDPLDDPDLQQVDPDAAPQDDSEVLTTDTLMRDDQDESGWEPDYNLTNATAELITSDDPDNETLTERLAQEEPDVDVSRGGAVDAEHEVREV
ncbi:hypothetical protein [Kineococcus sp. SYSU DK003]|uniref:hypothetical protein n=1 Tax=Kineococcus sp. SYSU DK003 TaxID=3383124 RepID=UPI003D7D733D